MTPEGRRILFKAAEAIAEFYGPDFVGRVEVNLFKGGVGTINVLESLKKVEVAVTSDKTT